MSIGKVSQGGTWGTCWLISPRHAITANHCVGDIGSLVLLEFRDAQDNLLRVDAQVLSKEEILDGALLQFDCDIPLVPLAICGCENISTVPGVQWNGHGFPARAQPVIDRVALHGTIINQHGRLSSGFGRAPVIQIFCEEGQGVGWISTENSFGQRISYLQGISGGPVCVPNQNNRVIGIIRCSPFSETTIFATPIYKLMEAFKEHLPGVVLYSWQTDIIWIQSDPSAPKVVHTNISGQNIHASWQHGGPVRQLFCNLRPADAGLLVAAILRIALHAPSVTQLIVTKHELWRERFSQLAKDWIPLKQFDAGQLTPTFTETPAGINHAGGESLSIQEVASMIHATCDRWILDELSDQIERVFASDNSVGIFGFQIALDIRAQMRMMWQEWRQSLEADTLLLHHFLALMVTINGEHDTLSQPVVGAGPRTLDRCILRTLAFSLAVSSCSETLFMPKGLHPGNLSHGAGDGHACGIEVHNGVSLHSALRKIADWKVRVLLLTHLSCSQRELTATNKRINEPISGSRPTLDRPPIRTLLLPGDQVEMTDAMAQGVDALSLHLADLSSAFSEEQNDYLCRVEISR
jgi:hypothetical protein